jgi:hypothetical protein
MYMHPTTTIGLGLLYTNGIVNMACCWIINRKSCKILEINTSIFR